MQERTRILKRTKIATVYLVFFLAIISSGYFIFKQDPSCQDGILNQNEERVDCGGPCFPCPERLEVQNLEIEKTEWTASENNQFEVVAAINNPNELVGLENFNFRVHFLDKDQQRFFTSGWEKGFILPKEKKSLTVLNLSTEQLPTAVQVELDEKSFLWKKFSQYDEPDLFVVNPRYEQSGQEGKYQVAGTLVNKSKVDFEVIKIKVILRDQENRFLGTNYQIINTVRSGEQRDFLVFFPDKGNLSVAEVEVEPETNVFSSDNFIRQYGVPERWDE